MESFDQFLRRVFGSRNQTPPSGGGGSPGGSGYYSTPNAVIPGAVAGGYGRTPTTYVSSQPNRGGAPVSGGGGVLAGFGFSTTGEAAAWGFNPSLKYKDDLGADVTGEEIESSRNTAQVDVVLASQGSGDFGTVAAPTGFNPGFGLIGLAAVALVGYSLFAK